MMRTAPGKNSFQACTEIKDLTAVGWTVLHFTLSQCKFLTHSQPCDIIFAVVTKPTLYTSLSPALLHLYSVRECIVVVIDVLRATSTIATVLHNGARAVIPVDSVEKCIRLGKEMECITAGERDGKVAEGLQYGNSSFEYPASFVKGKILCLPLPMAPSCYTWHWPMAPMKLPPVPF